MSDANKPLPIEEQATQSAIANRQSAIPYSPIVARKAIGIRPAGMGDLAFIDSLQKKHSRELGFLPTKALEGKIKLGQVLVAEATEGNDEVGTMNDELKTANNVSSVHHSSFIVHRFPIGYLIAADRYQKRDEIGYVTQIGVLPEYRRHLVAGQLLQAQFDRSAYGCRLYCCWCAQDLAANEFWASMGFTAIAFRTGSMKRGRIADCRMPIADLNAQSEIGNRKSAIPRVHIFWQKRIRAGDDTTAWWYPSVTGGGEIREDRLVFPIPAGVNWRDVGPILLGRTEVKDHASLSPQSSALSPRKKAKPAPLPPPPMVSPRERGGMWFAHEGVPDPIQVAQRTKQAEAERALALQPKPKAEKSKIDPKLMTMARELRDQWTERAGQMIQPATGKHDVKRLAEASAGAAMRQIDRAA